jgi:hypothetical protein
MPSRFTSGVYDPKLVKLMSDAVDAACLDYEGLPRNLDLARQIMATGIIEAVDANERSPKALVAAAKRALDEAMGSALLRTALRATPKRDASGEQ